MIEQSHVHPEPEPLSSSETAGSILTSARMGWDLSIEDVAANLNLSVDTVRALEKDEYDKLPGTTFVKGYVRAYANLLRLNPDEVISTLDLAPEKVPDIPTVGEAIKLKSKGYPRKKKKSRIVIKSLFFLILLAGLFFVGLTQWSKLNKEELAKIFKLPVSQTETDQSSGNTLNGNEIILLESESSDSSATNNSSEDSSKDKEKSALIRIE